MLEIWQADADGIYPGNDPRGAARSELSPGGVALPAITTPANGRSKPSNPAPCRIHRGRCRRHISPSGSWRGASNVGLQTRMYFPDEDNGTDPILSRIEHQNRVPTLIAEKEESRGRLSL